MPNLSSHFKNLGVIARKENFSVKRKLNEACENMHSRNDRLIFSEDDNALTPGLLDYLADLCRHRNIT